MPTDRSVLVRLKADASDFNRAMVGAKAALKGVRDEIDTTNDRTAWLAQGFLALAPAAAPIGAAIVPAIAGLATQMTVAAGAAGVMGMAFGGVGDALGAVNDYQLKPTEANLEKMRLAMDKIGPAGAEFVNFLDEIGPKFTALRMSARENMFPGVTEGIEEFMVLLPQLDRVVSEIATGIGDLTSEAGSSLAGPRFAEFFNYLETDARPILMDMGRTMGNFVDGLAAMMVAFSPLTSDFSRGFLNMSRDFAGWAHGLEDNQSFQDFVDYVRESVPKVTDLLGSIADAFVGLLRAAAPVGDIMLPLLARFFDVIAAIADSPLGPVLLTAAAAMSIYGRAAALASITTGGLGGKMGALALANARTALSFKGLGSAIGVATTNMMTAGAASQRMAAQSAVARSRIGAQGRAMAGMGTQAALLGVVMSDLDDKMGLTNTAMFALMGSMLGPWGAAAGAAIGVTMDWTKTNDALTDSLKRADLVAGSPTSTLADLKAQREAVAGEFAKIANAGASGNFARAWTFLSGGIDDTKDTIRELDGQIAASEGVNRRYKAALGLTERGFKIATASADEFADSVAGLDRLLSKRASRRDYEASLDAFTAGLKENGRTLDINTEKGRANQANLDAMATTALKFAETLAGSNRIEFLKQARQDLIDAGGKLTGGKAQAELLMQALDDLDKKRANPKVDVDTRAAFAQLSVFEQTLAGLTGKQRTIYINTVHNSIFNPTAGSPGNGLGVIAPVNRASGGSVRGPGTSTSDSIPALLSDGEFVVRAAAVNKYGADFMDNINAMRLAEGGLATYARSRDMDRMRYQSVSAASSRTAPRTVDLGDIHITGTLQTPFGPSHVEGVARAVARQEIDADASYRAGLQRMDS